MIIVLYSRINRGGAEVRRLGGADAQAQAPRGVVGAGAGGERRRAAAARSYGIFD